MTPTVHIVGAGLAGLSAALHALDRGLRVAVYEGAPQAGGRCRSYHDARLGRTIDNGNHLILSGNRSVHEYRRLAGADPATLIEAEAARFPFVDLGSGERWTVHMNDGPVPWWAFDRGRRPRGVGLVAMMRAGALLFSGPSSTVGRLARRGEPAFHRFWEPMSLAVINLPPEDASAELLRATFLEAWRDGRLARPLFAPRGLGAALVDPALGALDRAGSPVRFGARLKGIETVGGRVSGLVFARGEPAALGPEDSVILALPLDRLAELMPELALPEGTSSILNAHFVPDDPSVLDRLPPLLGVVGGVTHWIFVKDGMVSLTVSSADALEGTDGNEQLLLDRLWHETVAALDLPAGSGYAAGRLVREKRATFRQTPDNVARRPKQTTRFANLFLAGDFVDTGLPATIEGAVRSGERAARLAA